MTGPKPRTLAERFHPKVDRSGGPDACWPWLGASLPRGYGHLGERVARGRHRMVYAHRVAWELHHGRAVPQDTMVLHHCDNPPCCNPAHLFLGTQRDNMQDCARKGRQVFQQHPERAPIGERNIKAKLTWVAVAEIRSSTSTDDLLALRLGVSVDTIRDVRARRTWTGVSHGA